MTDATGRAAALEPKLATVHIVVTPATLGLRGLEIRLDDVVVDRFQYGGRGVIALYPGKHRLTAFAPGKQPWSLSFESVIGAPATANLDLADAAPVSPQALPEPRPVPPPMPNTSPRSTHSLPEGAGTTQRRFGLLAGGVGAAGVIVGAITGTLTLAKKGSLQSTCGAFTGDRFVCPAGSRGQVDDTYSSAKTLGAVSTTAFIAGGVLLAAGVTLYFTAPRSGNTTALGVAAAGGRMGLSLTQSW
jgi:hypothetical protein